MTRYTNTLNGRYKELNKQIDNFRKQLEECEATYGKNSKNINIAELRQIVNSIFSHIENDLALAEVELTEDYYWNIADEVLYMGDGVEGELTVGSLYADLDFLQPLVSDKAQAFPLMLIHVAPLLRFMAMNIAATPGASDNPKRADA